MLFNRSILEELFPIKGLDPVADFADTDQYSDIISLKDYEKIAFLVYKGVGTTGTSTLTVEACDDVSASNVSAVAFKYREYITASSDLPGTIKDATSTGFTTTAGSSQLYVCEINVEALLASGYKFCRLKMHEVTNSPVLGGVLVLLANPRFQGAAIPRTQIA